MIWMLLAYAGLTVVVVATSTAHAWLAGPGRDEVARPASTSLRAFVAAVAPGTTVGRWVVHEVGPLRSGNLRVELRAGGERVALTLARPDMRGPPPLAGTATVALYPAVHDLAAYTPTPAVQQAAAELASLLARREAPPDLLPLH